VSSARTPAGRVAIRPQAVVLDDAFTVDQHVRYFQAAHAHRRTGPAAELIGRLGCAG